MPLGLSDYEVALVDRAIKGDPLTVGERGELVKLGRLIESKRKYVNDQLRALIDRLDEESSMRADFEEKLAEFNETADTITRAAAERGADDGTD